jgi:hypothetical protein
VLANSQPISQTLAPSDINMKTYLEILVEVPCFKCLLWNPIKESHLHCNPNECELLTEWVLKQAEEKPPKENLIIAPVPTGSLKKWAKRA